MGGVQIYSKEKVVLLATMRSAHLLQDLNRRRIGDKCCRSRSNRPGFSLLGMGERAGALKRALANGYLGT